MRLFVLVVFISAFSTINCSILLLIILLKRSTTSHRKWIDIYSILGISSFNLSSIILMISFIISQSDNTIDLSNFTLTNILVLFLSGLFWRSGQILVYLLFLHRFHNCFLNTKYAYGFKHIYWIFYSSIIIWYTIFIVKYILWFLSFLPSAHWLHSIFTYSDFIELYVPLFIDLIISIAILSLFVHQLWSLIMDMNERNLITRFSYLHDHIIGGGRSVLSSLSVSEFEDSSYGYCRMEEQESNMRNARNSMNERSGRKLSDVGNKGNAGGNKSAPLQLISTSVDQKFNDIQRSNSLQLNEKQFYIIFAMSKIMILSTLVIISSQIYMIWDLLVFRDGNIFYGSMYYWLSYQSIDCMINSLCIFLSFDWNYEYYLIFCKTIDECCVVCCANCAQQRAIYNAKHSVLDSKSIVI